ncbi:Lar family restriction alleviation protein [Pararhizobium sp. DWP1-1-3]|uniref:Lar family restriction alleviation protein n=1 Tax=Pararhizobium sp. DWP1-1-3 TaxID=2804652 RepID=UPI003CE87C10
MSDILKPCPFCGGSASIERYGDRRQSTIYQCDNCSCSLETGEEWGHGQEWNRRSLAQQPLSVQEGWQDRVAAAHLALFHDDPTDVEERRARFAEEVNETLQAFGMSREDMHRLVDYSWDRPVGEPAKEIGAALLTLTSLCVIAGYDLMACGEADLEKLQRPETIARIRAKRATRHGRGPLPGFDPAAFRDAKERKE